MSVSSPSHGEEERKGPEPRSRRGRPPGRPRRESLTPQQERAILVLAVVDNNALAGRVVGVDEGTVRRWRRLNPLFRSELERRRGEYLFELEEDASAVRREVLDRRRELIHSEDDAVAWRVVEWHLRRYERIIDRMAAAQDVELPAELRARLDALDEPPVEDDAR
jgi:hypothetical protein